MEAKLSKIGNSQGIIIPKAIIEQCGLKEKIKMEVKNNCLIISSVNPREGWEEAILAAGNSDNDELLMGDYLEHGWDEEKWTW